MARKRLPKSLRKYIRKEKARIRREFYNSEEQDQKIKELIARFHTPAPRAPLTNSE